ncbi:MAG: flagellar motor protein MotB, partial [Xanthomonadales bacterium]|nr:flagellar motor protein MotB [Xanthomonadales bacterium]
MAGAEKKVQPIIVKKIKKGGHGHHGGAWKIAYADFVTAMMAFFLLMWLLGSTTSGDLQGIANYFQSPLQVALSGGSGSGDASHVIKGGGRDLTRSSGQVKNGENEMERKRMNLAAAKAEQRRREKAMLERLKEKVESALAANPKLMEMKSQIKLDLTVEGLRIQLVDEHSRPMFDIGSAVVKDYMREALREIGKVLNEVDNRISLSGHTDSAPYSNGVRGYSNWELSADRANASRRELIAGGMDDDKIIRVLGLAAAVPADTENPRAPSNRRISIVVMNKDAEERVLRGVEVQV